MRKWHVQSVNCLSVQDDCSYANQPRPTTRLPSTKVLAFQHIQWTSDAARISFDFWDGDVISTLLTRWLFSFQSREFIYVVVDDDVVWIACAVDSLIPWPFSWHLAACSSWQDDSSTYFCSCGWRGIVSEMAEMAFVGLVACRRKTPGLFLTLTAGIFLGITFGATLVPDTWAGIGNWEAPFLVHISSPLRRLQHQNEMRNGVFFGNWLDVECDERRRLFWWRWKAKA